MCNYWEGRQKGNVQSHSFCLTEERPVVQNTQKWVLSRDTDSLSVPVPSVISSQCLFSEPPCLPPAIVSCFPFLFTYFLIC